jgi:hypothetical protein
MAILLLFIIYMNFPLFGQNYVLKIPKPPPLTPKTRVVFTKLLGTNLQRQTDDIVYFTTPSQGYDRATAKIEFINASPSQPLLVGFKDKTDWHYFTKPVDLPLINSLKWIQINSVPPILYSRKEYKFTDVNNLLDNPPNDPIGAYYTDTDFEIGWLPDYKKSKKWTTINIPLRGSHSFYVFLENEPFSLQVKKQDLNRYEGPDSMKVSVYKRGVLMSESTGVDDGIAAPSRIKGKIQTIVVQDNGATPDNGVYRVDIKTNDDTSIDSVTTTLSKIVWIPPIFPLSPTTLFTDARELTFKTLHTPSVLPILLNGQPINIPVLNEIVQATASANYNTIKLAEGDIIVGGAGMFAFSQDQYFTPYVVKKIDIKSEADLSRVNYLITDYVRPTRSEDGYEEATLEFDLSNAVYDNDKLSWIIQAPGLKKNGGEVLIKNITITLHKDPIL